MTKCHNKFELIKGKSRIIFTGKENLQKSWLAFLNEKPPPSGMLNNFPPVPCFKTQVKRQQFKISFISYVIYWRLLK
jgi:hypothetical protein